MQYRATLLQGARAYLELFTKGECSCRVVLVAARQQSKDDRLEQVLNMLKEQRKFDELLGKRIEKIEVSQVSSSDTIDSSLHRIYAEMHQLAGSLLDVITRLEDRFDSLMGRVSCDAEQQGLPTEQNKPFEQSKCATGKTAVHDKGNTNKKKLKKVATRSTSLEPDIALEGISSARGQSRPCSLWGTGMVECLPSACGSGPVAGTTLPPKSVVANVSSEINLFNPKKIESIDKKIELIAISMGVSGVCREFDHEEDRKRLKEKLRQAIEVDRRSRIRPILSQTELWLEYVFGICTPNQRLGKRGSRLIHPRSRFMSGQLFMSGILLLYTAVVAPVQVFVWEFNEEECIIFPTIYFDLFVDTFFMIEIILQFLTGSLDMSEVYCDDFSKIAVKYLSSFSGFWFDFVSSLPWSLNDLYAYQLCTLERSPNMINNRARVLRIVKILRIMKIIRLLKAVKVVEWVEDYGVIYLGSPVFKIARLLFVAMFSVHLFACIFYRVKISSASSPEDVTTFYSSKQVSDDDLGQKYMVCFYFVLTTFTTVGYASLFGTIISQVNEIVADFTTKKKELDQILEAYLALNPRLDLPTIFQVRTWERFQFMIDYEVQQHKGILARTLPDALKLTIAKKIENNLFSKISFLTGLKAMGEIRALFAAELLLRSETLYYAQGSTIADSRDECNGLFVITSGQVGAELPVDSEDAATEIQSANGNTLLFVFERGDCLGDCSLVGDLRWAGTYGVSLDFIARSHCSVQFISIEVMQKILEKFEFFPIKCRVHRSLDTFQMVQESRTHDTCTFKVKAIFFWILVVRHISRCLFKDPHHLPIPTPLPEEFTSASHCQTTLSSAQAAQIREIFDLFDTDGTGCIEQHEMGFALSALGFQSQEGTRRSRVEKDALDTIMGDGKVTLEEFSNLMTGDIMSGDIGGNAMYEEARTAYSVLSRPDGNARSHGLITLSKLESVCKEFQVLLSPEDLKMMMDEVTERSTSVEAHENGDGHGTVNLKTFLTIMKKAAW